MYRKSDFGPLPPRYTPYIQDAIQEKRHVPGGGLTFLILKSQALNRDWTSLREALINFLKISNKKSITRNEPLGLHNSNT